MKDQLFELIQQGTSMRQVQLMIESGHDINCFNDRHETPLMASMVFVHDPEKRQQLVRMFLMYGADINSRNRRGQTAFMYACILNQTDTTNILLNDLRLDVNVQDFEGNTAVMYACALGNIATLKMIVAANETGAINIDPDITNNDDASAEDYAADSMDDDMIASVTTLKDTWARRACEVNMFQQVTLSSKSKQKKKPKSKERITRLAETIETHENVDPAVVIWKEDEQGKPVVVETTEEETQSPVEPAIHKKRSVLNIHLPRTYDDEMLDEASTEDTSRPYSATFETEEAVTTSDKTNRVKNKKNKRRKTKKNRKKSRIQTRDAEVLELSDSGVTPQQREFGNEFVFCNKIYGTDLYPCNEPGEEAKVTTVEELLDNITSKAMDNYNSLSSGSDKTVSSADTGRKQYSKLSARDRARFLSRAIWSVYGEPLPPIPISADTMDRILSGIAELRQYLSRAKYQPGRLLSLDPELWCIIESMKTCSLVGLR